MTTIKSDHSDYINMKDDNGDVTGENIKRKILKMTTTSNRAFEEAFAALAGKSPVVFPGRHLFNVILIAISAMKMIRVNIHTK